MLERGEHVALIGPNGSGKTTLLEAIVNRRLGRIGHGVELAYFSQHEVELDERGSVLECTMGATGLQRGQAQKLLGRFLFSGWDDHDKPVVALSGGERRRLALALIVASGANFLVLDEPTNHLDLESREALEAALEAFPGTVLLVSHDRAVLDAVAERIVAVEDGTLRSYPGGWADYVRIRADEDAPAPAPKERKEKEKRPKTRGRSRRGRASSSRSRRRSRPASWSWPSSSSGSPRTGATSQRSPRTRSPATTSRCCSSAGSSSSSPRNRCDDSPSGGVDTVCKR